MDRFELGDARMEEDGKVLIKMLAFNIAYPQGKASTTEMRYEDGRWCKVLSDDIVEWLGE